MTTATLPRPTKPRARTPKRDPDFGIPPQWVQRRWTVDEYHHMIETGLLGPEDRYELIHGWIVKKMSINPPHSNTVRKLSRFLDRLLGDAWVVSVQQPVTTEESEPEPDMLVCPGPMELYDQRHPGPADAAIIVEVADSNLAYDRTTKLELYAEAGVPVYWILNLVEGIVEVYTQPRGGKSPGYRKRADYAAGQAVPVRIGRAAVGSIPVSEFLS